MLPEATNVPPTTRPTRTTLPTDTPAPTQTLEPATPRPTQTATATHTSSPAPTTTQTATSTTNPTRTVAASATPSSTIVPSATASAEATAQPTETPESTAEATAAVVPGPEVTPPGPSGPADGGDGGAGWAILIASVLIVGAALYGAFYWRGMTAVHRHDEGFAIDRCPVCGRGQLSVDTRVNRILGVPRPSHTVRCNTCRSLLREVRPGRWRYAVDPLENPAMAERYNGKVLSEAELRRLDLDRRSRE